MRLKCIARYIFLHILFFLSLSLTHMRNARRIITAKLSIRSLRQLDLRTKSNVKSRHAFKRRQT